MSEEQEKQCKTIQRKKTIPLCFPVRRIREYTRGLSLLSFRTNYLIQKRNLNTSLKLAQMSKANNRSIPTICARSRNLSLGLRRAIIS